MPSLSEKYHTTTPTSCHMNTFLEKRKHIGILLNVHIEDIDRIVAFPE
jgi:hypothetical protein